MTTTETQTFETANGQAEQQQEEEQHEVLLPPDLADAIDGLDALTKRLRKGVEAKSEGEKQLKRWIANHQQEALARIFVLFGQGFTETYRLAAHANGLAAQLHADQATFRSFVLTRFRALGIETNAPLIDGDVSEEQIDDVRRDLAQLGLVLARRFPEDQELNDLFANLAGHFADLLGQDDLLADPDDGDDDDDDDDHDDDDDDDDGDRGDEKTDPVAPTQPPTDKPSN